MPKYSRWPVRYAWRIAIAVGLALLVPIPEAFMPAQATSSATLRLCRALQERAAWAKDGSCENVAKFEDGHDRKIVNELREKDPAELSAKEEAILKAANRVGGLNFCSRVSGNAFLVALGEKPAIVTSAHILIDDKTGDSRCASKPRKIPKYYPNFSYYVPGGDNEYALRPVELVYPPLNLARVEGRKIPIEYPDDVLIFFLREDISQDRMRDGRIRGAFKLPQEQHDEGTATMIGVAPDIQDGVPMLYQDACNYEVDGALVRHSCDTVAGSSGSFLGVMEDGDLVLLAVHNYSKFGNETVPGNLGTFSPAMNGGVSASRILAQSEPQADHHAYHIQWVLHEAGCYAGKLDNLWGVGSRRALDAFAAKAGIELPGRAPSFELLDTVEAVPDGKGACR